MGVLDNPVVSRVRRSPRLRPAAIAAYRAADRLLPAPAGPRVLVNSMPKSGTHLLASLVDQARPMRFSGRLVAFDVAAGLDPAPALRDLERQLRLLRPSHYIGAHLIRHPAVEAAIEASGASLVTILRDPRSVVLSGAHYVASAPQLAGRDEALALFPDVASILTALVRGHGSPGDPMYFPEIGERYRAYAGWWGAPTGLAVRFEDLVGSRGGGDAGAQTAEVRRILDHLGRQEVDAEEVAGALFSERSITFRSGEVDSWRREMPSALAAEVVERCADSMTLMGYAE